MNIMIVYGGKSCEHDISIITACLAKGYFKGNIYSVYFDRDNKCYLVGNDMTPRAHVTRKLTKRVTFVFGEGKITIRNGKLSSKTVPIDVAVNCCHGLSGEDGCIAALCQMANIPLVGTDITSSAVAMDKTITKHVLNDMGMPTVAGVALTKTDLDSLTQSVEKLTYPLIVKPAMLGSSIGVEVCHDGEQLRVSLNKAFTYCDKVLCEEALTDFIELNCAAMRVKGNVETSVVDCPMTTHDILTFADKYISNEAFEKPPVDVAEEVKEEVKRLTTEIYTKIGFSGVIRVDYLLDNKTGKLYVNEINTTPGSLAYGLWEAKYSRTQYGEALVDQAIADYRELQQRVYTFDSGVLNGGGGIKKK